MIPDVESTTLQVLEATTVPDSTTGNYFGRHFFLELINLFSRMFAIYSIHPCTFYIISLNYSLFTDVSTQEEAQTIESLSTAAQTTENLSTAAQTTENLTAISASTEVPSTVKEQLTTLVTTQAMPIITEPSSLQAATTTEPTAASETSPALSYTKYLNQDRH